MAILKELYKAYISLDIISGGPKLLHQGSERYTNFLGSTLTLLAIALSFCVNLEDLQKLIENKDPNYTKSTFYSNSEKIQVNSTSLKLFFTLQNFDLDLREFSLIPTSTLPYLPAQYMYLNINSSSYTPIGMNFTDKNDSLYNDYLQSCDDEFFEDYNKHLEYGQTELTTSQLHDIKNSSYCISPKLKSLDIYSPPEQNGSKYLLMIAFFDSLFETLEEKGYKYPAIILNYQHLVVNTGEEFYNNSTYFRKVWKNKFYSLNKGRFYSDYVKISKTVITRNRKLLFFKREDKNTTYTIENIEPFINFDLNLSTIYQLAYSFLVEMDVYHSSITLDYISLGDILSNYGGCSSIMFILFQSFNGFFVEPFLTSSLLNSSFNFHENSMTAEEVNNLLEGLDKINNEDNSCRETKTNLKFVQIKSKRENENNSLEMQRLKDPTVKKENDNSNMILRDNVKIKAKTTETNVFSTQEVINNINSVLDIYYPLRKTKIADEWQVLRMSYCGKLCTKKRDAIFKNYMSLVEKYSEISNFIKIQREIEILKHMTMNFEERELYLLPSVSIKVQENDSENDELINSDFETNLHKIREKLKELNLKDDIEKILLKGILKSIV